MTEDTGFAYFMIRVQRPFPNHPTGFAGVIERLGTGEKRTFGSGEELVGLLSAWPGGSSKMQGEREAGNRVQPEAP